jgi:hypothetical protein
MPYIKQESRDQLDPAIENLLVTLMLRKVNGLQVHPAAGDYNYIITRLLDMGHSPHSYDSINTIMGILECVKQEYYRRIAAPYEGEKMYQNGDVYCSP